LVKGGGAAAPTAHSWIRHWRCVPCIQMFSMFCAETSGSIDEILLGVWIRLESTHVSDQQQCCA